MKTMKRMAGILLALVMAMALTIPAFAATVENKTTHTYNAYQIFAATNQNGDGGALGNITWGNGINHEEFLPDLKDDSRCNNAFANCASAADVAKVLAENVSLADVFADIAVEHLTANKTAVGSSGTVELALGYWLLVDTTEPGVGDAKNAALLQVINKGNLTIEKKYSVPTVDKTVDDNDANIGDTVTFTLTATMPSRLDGYETYKVEFHDTMSKGLTFKGLTSVEIVTGETTTNKTNDFTLTPEQPTAGTDGETKFTISCDDVLELGATINSKIVVKYTATVNSKAVIGTAGNPNKVGLEYSNDPNWDGEGDEPTGKTPEDEVKVYTWEIPVFKYTGTDTPLAGAGFTLYKTKTTEGGTDKYSDPVKVTKDTTVENKNSYKVDPSSETIEIVTDTTGRFSIEGLEQGTYYLKETTTPEGYNTVSVVTVVIGENGALTQDGSATTEVAILNQAGTILPETGGIGTTIFYVLGGALMLGAVVLLVTKKRMSAE